MGKYGEPWGSTPAVEHEESEGLIGGIEDTNGQVVLSGCHACTDTFICHSDLQRLFDCVNACEGIEDPQHLLDTVRRAVDKMFPPADGDSTRLGLMIDMDTALNGECQNG